MTTLSLRLLSSALICVALAACGGQSSENDDARLQSMAADVGMKSKSAEMKLQQREAEQRRAPQESRGTQDAVDESKLGALKALRAEIETKCIVKSRVASGDVDARAKGAAGLSEIETAIDSEECRVLSAKYQSEHVKIFGESVVGGREEDPRGRDGQGGREHQADTGVQRGSPSDRARETPNVDSHRKVGELPSKAGSMVDSKALVAARVKVESLCGKEASRANGECESAIKSLQALLSSVK